METVKFDYNSGLVDRKFTEKWSNSGVINIDKIPLVITSLIEQRKSMVEYIEALHDKIDKLIKDNNICDNPSCHRSNCTSDHK